MNPCWIGSNSPPCSRSSTVRIVRPSAIAVRTVHDFTGSPSIHTTHTPQFEVSQPQWLPVSRRWSRRKWISNNRGSTSRVTSSPLTFIVTSIMSLPVLERRRGAVHVL